MESDLFLGAKLKIERADHHITDLQRQFRAFVQSNPHAVVVERDPETGCQALLVDIGGRMPTFGLIIGDAIHNLRTALDHLMWEIVGRDGGKQDRHLKFPFGEDKTRFEAFCKGIKTPSQNITAMLISLEAYPRGKSAPLYYLNMLDNIDKHRITNPVIRVSRIDRLAIVYPNGAILMTFEDCLLVGTGSGRYATIVSQIPAGMSLKIDENAKITPDIFFWNVEPFPGKPIIPTLRQLSQFTRETIDIIERSI